jgi:D-beta-D-heptose 7-phosphate kinase/D-beta-D-heptose 1-phosphate adenosyltransferase
VFTNGCFDLLHAGHVSCLEEARRMGDVLVVGVNSDASIRKLKGNERPIIEQQDRIRMLTALSCVTFVVVFDEDTPCSLLKSLRPDVLVKGGTYLPHEVVGHEIVEQYGGRIEVVSIIEGLSTTALLSKIRNRELTDVASNYHEL